MTYKKSNILNSIDGEDTGLTSPAVSPTITKNPIGKILRATMRCIADGKSFNMPSTIEDPLVLEELKKLMAEKKIGEAFN